MKLGEVLKKERERKKLTAEDVAGRIAIPLEQYMLMEGGESPIGVASTVVDLTSPVPRVLRQGAVSIDRLRDVIGDLELPD